MLIKSGRVVMYSRLVEGRFPKWRDVFPRRENSQRIEMVVGPSGRPCDRRRLSPATSGVASISLFPRARWSWWATAHEYGESNVELPIAYDGPEIVITLDPRYLNDFLRVLNPESTLVLELRDAEAAAVCSTDDGYAYVIMPLAREK